MGSGSSYDPDVVRVQIREIEGKIENAEYESGTAQLLGDILASANDRNTDQIQAHLTTIQQAIEREVDGFVDLLFGGSVARNTYVAGVSDVDALVVLNDSELSTKSPLEVRDYFIERLRERLPNTPVNADGFAVSVEYADGLVELVPVKRHGQDYLLPSGDLQTWSRVRPSAFAEALKVANRETSGKLIPTIKLAKVALTELPEARRPTGYHLEALALEAFAGYQGGKSPKQMLPYFFVKAAQRVLNPIPDPTGQSRHVDDYLGPSMSLERQVLADSLGRIARRLNNADGAHSIDQWKAVFGIE